VSSVGRGFAEKLAIKQRKVEFLEGMVERKAQYTDERDRLIIKQLEVKVINTFNMYRIPFVAGSLGFCVAFFLRSKRPLYFRMMPLIFLGSFSSLYNYQIGQYGVYRTVDDFFDFLTTKKDSQVALEASTFLT
jgi:hypothetical protein